MKITGIHMKHSEMILSFVYYAIVDDRNAALSVFSRFSRSIQEVLSGWAAKFMGELNGAYGADFIGQLRRYYRDSDRTCNASARELKDGYDLYALASGEAVHPPEELLLRLARRLDDALCFLFAFNTQREIIRELLPGLPDPGEAYDIAREINEHTKIPDGLFLLAASTDSDSMEAGYILKNWMFQGYSFSIFKGDGDVYSFEFVSGQESLKGKIIHVSIILPHGQPVILEELCSIDTHQYTLSYSGELPREADIKPGIITMK